MKKFFDAPRLFWLIYQTSDPVEHRAYVVLKWRSACDLREQYRQCSQPDIATGSFDEFMGRLVQISSDQAVKRITTLVECEIPVDSSNGGAPADIGPDKPLRYQNGRLLHGDQELYLGPDGGWIVGTPWHLLYLEPNSHTSRRKPNRS